MSSKITHLLMVDDNCFIRKAYKYMFSRWYDITLAENGAEALNLFLHGEFDAIVTDIEMPKLSGIELTQEIRALNILERKPLIVGISAASQDVIEEALSAGMDIVFPKPTNLEKIQQYFAQHE